MKITLYGEEIEPQDGHVYFSKVGTQWYATLLVAARRKGDEEPEPFVLTAFNASAPEDPKKGEDEAKEFLARRLFAEWGAWKHEQTHMSEWEDPKT